MASSESQLDGLDILANLYELSILAIPSARMKTKDYGETKKGRHLSLTDTAFNHLGNIAHEARLSNSETLERLIRSTPIWEGSATLSDGAFSLIEDYAVLIDSTPDSLLSVYEDESLPA